MTAITIYLDFDGVLHATTRPTNTFEHLDAFQQILREHPNVQVVISSSWRETYSFQEIRDFFADDLHARIIGVTPVISSGPRFDEIMAHRTQADFQSEFIVLDDDASQFPADWPPLLLCDPSVGLGDTAMTALEGRLGAVLI